MGVRLGLYRCGLEGAGAELLGSGASKRDGSMSFCGSVYGLEEELVFFFLTSPVSLCSLRTETSSVDDFSCCKGVTPVAQKLEFGRGGWAGGINDELANGRGNIDGRE